jgi:serine/threonine protein kinase
MTQSNVTPGTTDYMAPELLGGGVRPTTKSDIWSFGVLMYQLSSINAALCDENVDVPTMPVLLPQSVGVSVPVATVGGNPRLADLIGSALLVAPEQRPSAADLLAHPYFSISLIQDLAENKELIASNEKLDAFRSFVHALRSGQRTPVLVSVVRSQMVESVTNIFNSLNEAELLMPIMVVFQGEQGIDEGALTSEMLTTFFQQLATKHRILVSASDASESDSVEIALFQGKEYVVTADPKASPTVLTVLGKVLLKSIIENRPLPLQINLSQFKFLVGARPTMQDLEAFDQDLALSLKRLLLLSSEDLESSDLDFSEFPEQLLAAHRTKLDASTKVNVANVRDYIDLRIEYEMIGKRESALTAVRKGFLTSSMLEPHLRLLSATELAILLCGQQHLSAENIIASLEFQGFPPTSQTPQMLVEILRSSSQNNLRRFLRLCTSQVAIPYGGFSRKIKILCTSDTTRLPVSHGCVYQLDLPDYNDVETLKSKLATALVHVNDGFHVV